MTDQPPASRAAEPRRHRLRATLGTHLVAIILAATLPLALMMSWRIVADGKQQRAELLAGLQSTAKAVRVGVERERIATRDALTVLGASDTLYRGDIEGFERRLASRGPFRPSWERVALRDPPQRQVAAEPWVPGKSPGMTIWGTRAYGFVATVEDWGR